MAKRKKQKADNRRRVRLPVWLDLNKQDEAFIADEVADLKNNRRFASTVRDAMRLILDLRAGRLDVLLMLFPWIQEALTPAATPPDTENLERQIAELKQLMIEQGGNRIDPDAPMVAAPPPKLSGLQPLGSMKPIAGSNRSLPLPLDDDDDDMLVLKKDTRTDASQNFLNSMIGLQQ